VTSRNKTYLDSVREFIIIEHGLNKYYIDLRLNHLATEGDVLNEILQLHEKAWCDGKTLHDFLTILQEAVQLRFNIDLRALKGGRLNWKEGKIER